MLYELTSENLTGLGGMMGTERTWNNWHKLFRRVSAAKAFAETDYRRQTRQREKVEWQREGLSWRTQDLAFVMYHIRPVRAN